MLIVSGYNVYPSHIENVLMKHPDVLNCGVIGIPHPYKVTVAKAFIVLKDGVMKSDELNFLDDKTVVIRKKGGKSKIINLNLIIEICIRRFGQYA